MSASLHPLQALDAVDAQTFAEVRRRTILRGFKWDPQVGDASSLAPFPIVMGTRVWRRLALLAEQLSIEATAAEEEALRRPELLRQLGLPTPLLRVLTSTEAPSPSAGRVTRFDFHWTRDGWRISESNSDVPGGFSEGSFFTARMAELFPALRRAGDPGQAWCQALARSAPPGAHFAFISAPGYLQDHQVVAYLATGLRERGISSWIGKPEQLDWQQGEAFWLPARDRQPLAAIIRFYQAEWLAELPARSAWQHLLRGGRTLVANPIQALISESKRFPVLWDQLTTSLATWRALLPESRDPRGFNGASREWLLKQAYSNNGDAVILPENEPDWRWARLKARLRPNTWVAQRRFESLPFPTPIGPRHACVGVYTVNGQATGAYVRLSSDPVVDYRAIDAALLLMNDD